MAAYFRVLTSNTEHINILNNIVSKYVKCLPKKTKNLNKAQNTKLIPLHKLI